MKTQFGFALLLLVGTAQATTVGKLPPSPSQTLGDSGTAIRTFIDLSHPASESGTISSFSVLWSHASSAQCGALFDAKIVRPGATYGTFSVVADLGQGDGSHLSYDLPAPVPVQAGDLIAVTQLKPLADCGSVYVAPSEPAETTLMFNGNVEDGVAPSAPVLTLSGSTISAAAFASELPYGTLPVVGSAQGAFNAFFRTAIQLTNFDASQPSDVRLTYHHSGRSASASDPGTIIHLNPQQNVSIDDFLPTIGESGVGSLDLTILSGIPPFVTARVFNDNGAAGTQGFTESVVPFDRVTASKSAGVLPFPADSTNFRMNVGVRSLGHGATVSFDTYSNEGAFVGSVVKSYTADYFEQVPVSAVSAGGGWIKVSVTDGSAVVYASYTDNRTNDSSIRYSFAP